MEINHPTAWDKEKLNEEWFKIRDEEVIEDTDFDFDDEYDEDEINRETDRIFKETYGYDFDELMSKFE